jgi:hypothetical protein
MVKRSTPASVGHLPELGFGADSGAVVLRVPRSLRVLPASRHRRSRGSSVQPVVAPPRILRPRADLAQEPASDQPGEPSAGGALGEADRLRDHAREETLAAGEGFDDRPVRLVERRAADPPGEDRDPEAGAISSKPRSGEARTPSHGRRPPSVARRCPTGCGRPRTTRKPLGSPALPSRVPASAVRRTPRFARSGAPPRPARGPRAGWWSLPGRRLEPSILGVQLDQPERQILGPGRKADGLAASPDPRRTTVDDLLEALKTRYRLEGRRSLERLEDAVDHLLRMFRGCRQRGSRAPTSSATRTSGWRKRRSPPRSTASSQHSARPTASVSTTTRSLRCPENNARQGFADAKQ